MRRFAAYVAVRPLRRPFVPNTITIFLDNAWHLIFDTITSDVKGVNILIGL
jgi:hypothetical protein